MVATDRPTLTLAQLDAADAHPSGGPVERRYNCPLPDCRGKPVDRQHQSLCVNTDSGLWTCFRCGAKGQLVERWAPRPTSGRELREARRLAALRAVRILPERQPGTAETAAVLPERLAACGPVAGTPGEAYLFSRGIGLDVATPAGVLYSPGWSARPGGRRAAVVFPMRGADGRVVAANARYLRVPEGQTKTLSLGDRSLAVFATPGALADREAPVVVVEGPFDALALAECGAAAVALVATVAPGWLAPALAFRRIYVGLDADAAGDEKSAALLEDLAPFARGVERLRPPTWPLPPELQDTPGAGKRGKDWADALLTDYVGLVDFLQEAVGG